MLKMAKSDNWFSRYCRKVENVFGIQCSRHSLGRILQSDRILFTPLTLIALDQHDPFHISGKTL